MKIDLPYLCQDTDRHGNRRLYVRHNGRKVRLRVEVGDGEFRSGYEAAIAELKVAPVKGKRAYRIGTLGWLSEAYFASPEYASLDAVSRTRRRAIIEQCLEEPYQPGAKNKMRDCPLSALTPQHILMLRDRKAKLGLLAAGNNRRKWLSAMFAWAIDHNHMTRNPARDSKRTRYATDGWHTWTVEEVRQYEQRHPIGTKARLALSLLLYLGVRRSDLVTLGRQHVHGGQIRFVPRKTRRSSQELSTKPILPELRKVIDASPGSDRAFLVTQAGNPFTAAGFGMWFRDRCNEAGLPHCSAHGLRKAAATIAADNGATAPQLMAMFDWESIQIAQTYIKKANKKKLAAQAARKIR